MIKNLYFKPENEQQVKDAIELCFDKGIFMCDTLQDFTWNELGYWGVDEGGNFVTYEYGYICYSDSPSVDFDTWFTTVESDTTTPLDDFVGFLVSELIRLSNQDVEKIYNYFKNK